MPIKTIGIIYTVVLFLLHKNIHSTLYIFDILWYNLPKYYLEVIYYG